MNFHVFGEQVWQINQICLRIGESLFTAGVPFGFIIGIWSDGVLATNRSTCGS